MKSLLLLFFLSKPLDNIDVKFEMSHSLQYRLIITGYFMTRFNFIVTIVINLPFSFHLILTVDIQTLAFVKVQSTKKGNVDRKNV